MLAPDLAHAMWRKSSHSGSNGNCVEVAFTADMIAIRDSKNPSGAMLIFTSAEWEAFVDGVRDGEFDQP